MALVRAIEEMIQEAMARGDFDNLPGKGKPLDHDAYFAAPEDLRLTFSVLKSAGYLPEEVQLLKDIKELEEQLATAVQETERRRLKKAIEDLKLSFRMAVERRQTSRRRGA